jgi:hypothetical protein
MIMPKITKQNAKKKVAKHKPAFSSILSKVVSVKNMPSTGIKMTMYGRGKTGKTRTACTFPKPLLIVGTEDGTKSVKSVAGVDFFRLSESSEIDELVEAIPDKYKTVALDGAGGLQDMIMKEILGLDDVPVEKSWGMAVREQWQSCGVQTKERLRKLLDLADKYGTHIVIIAHERNFNDEGGSDLIFPTVGASLTPSTAGWLNGACDYLCQTFLREQTVKKEVKVAGKKGATMSQKTGKIEYCLRVGPHPVYMTGFRRTHSENETMPDVIINPNYDKICELIG